MIKNKKKRIILILSLIIIALLISTTQVFAYSYSGHRWVSNGTTYDVSGVQASWRTAIDNAAYTWNTAGANFYFIKYSSQHTWGTVNWGDDGILAMTTVTYTDYIIDCDAVFNVYYNFYTDGRKYDVESVALHEFGHWLMLNDVNNPWDIWKVMFGSYNWKKHNLSDDDKSGIKYIYGTS
jgi:hypothetical protein